MQGLYAGREEEQGLVLRDDVMHNPRSNAEIPHSNIVKIPPGGITNGLGRALSADVNQEDDANEAERNLLSDVTNEKGDISVKEHYVPDGGWGWVVTLASAFCAGVSRGTIVSFTFVYHGLTARFNTNAVETAWIYSIFAVCNMWTSE